MAQGLKFKIKTRTSYLGSNAGSVTSLLLADYLLNPDLYQVLRKQKNSMKALPTQLVAASVAKISKSENTSCWREC